MEAQSRKDEVEGRIEAAASKAQEQEAEVEALRKEFAGRRAEERKLKGELQEAENRSGSTQIKAFVVFN